MTPARKAALQWFHDRGEVKNPRREVGAPSMKMIDAMVADLQLGRYVTKYGFGHPFYKLTDKGRRMLHGDSK